MSLVEIVESLARQLVKLNFVHTEWIGAEVEIYSATTHNLFTINEQVDNVIIRCAKFLHQGESIPDAAAKIMAEMGTLIHPDRMYFGLVKDGQIEKVREWCGPGVEKSKHPITETIHNARWWERYANKDDVIIVADVAEVMESAPGGIIDPMCRNFMEVLLKDGGQLIGYIGVENYVKAEVLNTKSLLQSIALFLNAEIKNQLLIEQLTILSRTDQLAGCDNRNAIHISIGWGWSSNSTERERVQFNAEQMMYKNKTEYYKIHDRRRRTE